MNKEQLQLCAKIVAWEKMPNVFENKTVPLNIVDWVTNWWDLLGEHPA